MAINPAAASATYLSNAQAATPGMPGGPAAGAEATLGSGFLDLVKGSMDQAIEANRNAERVSVDATAGRADLTDVVTALTHAETTLTTVVRVRDRMISAYQQIMRMPI